MSMIDQIWESAHKIPSGAIIPKGTELIQIEEYSGESELNIYKTLVEEVWHGYTENSPVRSVNPLPDPEDTGVLTFSEEDGVTVLEGKYCGYRHQLNRTQARNLLKKLAESLES